MLFIGYVIVLPCDLTYAFFALLCCTYISYIKQVANSLMLLIHIVFVVSLSYEIALLLVRRCYGAHPQILRDFVLIGDHFFQDMTKSQGI